MRLNGLNGMMMDYGVVHGFIFLMTPPSLVAHE